MSEVIAEQHPIFSRTALALGSKPSLSRRYVFTTDNGLKVILLQDGAVRWCYTTEPSYHSYTLGSRDIEIKNAIISKSGNYILFYTETKVTVMEIPWAFTDENASQSHCIKTYNYSFDIYDLKVKQVLFHPKATLESSIVVLLSDDSIALIDFFKPFEFDSNEQIFLNKKSKSISWSNQVSDIESITFSNDGMTLYVLCSSESTDIYAFYPCLPESATFDFTNLEFLVNKSLVQYENLEPTDSTEVKSNIIKQLHFTNGLFKTFVKAKEEKPSLHKLDFKISKDHLFPNAQGPFTMSPFPDTLYALCPIDIITVPLDKNEELLAILFNDGSLALLFQDLPMTMSWSFKEYNYNNSLILLELLEIPEKNIGKLTNLPDLFGSFYIMDGENPVRINTNSWSNNLLLAINGSNPSLMTNTKIHSEIIEYDLNDPNIISVIKWCDRSNERIIFLGDKAAYSYIYKKIPPKFELTFTKDQLIRPEEDFIFDNKSTSSIKANDVKKLNDSFSKSCKSPLNVKIPDDQREVKLGTPDNEELLATFTEIASEVGLKIGQGQMLGFTLYNKVLEQQKDLRIQIEQTSRLIQKKGEMSDKFEGQIRKFKNSANRFEKLMPRLKAMAEKIRAANIEQYLQKTEISVNEIEYFKELREQVLQFNQFVKKQKEQHETLIFIQKELLRITNEYSNADRRAYQEWKSLRIMLSQDTEVINECTESIKNINLDLKNALEFSATLI